MCVISLTRRFNKSCQKILKEYNRAYHGAIVAATGRSDRRSPRVYAPFKLYADPLCPSIRPSLVFSDYVYYVMHCLTSITYVRVSVPQPTVLLQCPAEAAVNGFVLSWISISTDVVLHHTDFTIRYKGFAT